MYPFARLAFQFWRHRNDPPLKLTETHVSRHICWPWDLDMFLEMNNGRVLTLFDLGRFTSGSRFGLIQALKRNRWGLAVAGSSVRYRRRITPFARIEMRTKLAGWDARFFYIVQEMWVADQCAAQVLLRTAVTEKGRSVETPRVVEALGRDDEAPTLPDWVQAWVDAEATRPWPPVSETA